MKPLATIALGMIAGLASCSAGAGDAPASRSAGLEGLGLLRADGSPRLPADYSGPGWTQIGTWAIAPGKGKDVKEQHLVFAQREAVAGFKEDGRWPDGSVLVKELRTATPEPMSTGHSAPTGTLTGWFVMVKGSGNPTTTTPHWGDGWYGSQYGSDDRDKNISPGWASCRGCHTPVKDTDWTFVQGYPGLAR